MTARARTPLAGWTRPRPRGPGIVYLVIIAVLVVALGVITFSIKEPPPPSIAEFAPQAVEQITDAPSDQGGTFGFGGEGPGGFGGVGEGPAPVPEQIEVARVRKCIGNPPRQIEDPQSPPCVAYWSGDNGGATYQGVTGDEIRIGVAATPDVTRLLTGFFNKRFEFYGRKLIAFGAGGGNNCSQKRGAAVHFDEVVQGFAATDPASGGVTCYYDELARRGLIAVTVDPHLNEQYMRSRHPYIWSYPMATETMFRNIGRWACRRLANQKARFSPDPRFQLRDRKFGIIMQTTTQVTGFDETQIKDELAACGQADVPFERYNHDHSAEATNPQGQGAFDPTTATNAVLKMQAADVTSVICLCVIFMEQYIPGAATAQNYFPEWLMSTWFFNDSSIYIKTFWPGAEQRQAMLGVTFRPREVPYEHTPILWALNEMQPGFKFSTSIELNGAYNAYRSLLMIASGIQMAGPRLTPETFARGLQSAKFPNPDHPIMAGDVGFAGDHGMTDDAAEFWWSENDMPPYPDEGSGAWCYVHSGKRYLLQEWPTGDADFFKGPCNTPVS